jgi:hypothetical protein
VESHRTATVGSGAHSPEPGSRGRDVEGPVRDEQLQSFYDRVIAKVLDCDALLLLGPGDAKDELVVRLARHRGLRARLVHSETAPRLSDSQFLARLRRFAAAADLADEAAASVQDQTGAAPATGGP